MTVLEPVVQFLMDYEGKKVTLEQAIIGAERPRYPVLRVMDRLTREGVLAEIEDFKNTPVLGGMARRNPVWRIIKKPVAITHGKVKRRSNRDRMWQLIRSRRRVTRSEIVRLCGVKAASAEDFTKLLVKHEYLREIGKDSHEKVFMLIKNPGPVRPKLKEDFTPDPEKDETGSGGESGGAS